MIPAAHLNETLKRAMPLVGRNKPEAVARALQSPYLTFDGTHDEGIPATPENMLKDDWGMTRTPFPLFRFCCDSQKRMIFGLCERREREISLLCFTREKATGRLGEVCWAITFRGEFGGMSYDGRVFDSRTMKDITKALAEAENVPPIDQKEVEAIVARGDRAEAMQRVRDARKDVAVLHRAVSVLQGQANALEALVELSEKTIPAGSTPELKDTFMALYGTVLLIAYNYLAPQNFMARVTPAKEGKSVEWLRAREHYTVIHRHHSANNAEVREGSVVSNTGNSQRLAHSRRAHTKLLSHPRYKFKMGQRIFVRATWVGPKEWKDTAGQTYQILTPVAR